MNAKVFEFEQLAEQAARGFRDHHRARLSKGLEPRSEIRCLANYRLFLRRTFTNEVTNDYQPSRDPYACRKGLCLWEMSTTSTLSASV